MPVCTVLRETVRCRIGTRAYRNRRLPISHHCCAAASRCARATRVQSQALPSRARQYGFFAGFPGQQRLPCRALQPNKRGRLCQEATGRCVFCALLFCLRLSSLEAATVYVAAGGDLQAALDAAQPGDTILLEEGAEFVGAFVLPAKTGDQWITLRTAAPDTVLPPTGMRIKPSHAPLLAQAAIPDCGGRGAAHCPWRTSLAHRLPGISARTIRATATSCR